jgi:NAD-dependent deacetylase
VELDDKAVDTAATLVLEADHLVALVGAGLSVESGIPPFRGPGGLWTRLGEPSMDGYRDFLRDPAEWWRQQRDVQADPDRTEFREAIERAEPNAGHLALAELERLGVLKMTITQNVDDLHRQAGQRRLLEIHGNRTMIRCIACELRWHRDHFGGVEYPLYCPECGGLVKSDTVMFGEPIPPGVLESCLSETEMCDCMLVCGTSATVYPAAGFPAMVKDRGGSVIDANPSPTPISPIANVVLGGPTGVSLPQLAARIKVLRG